MWTEADRREEKHENRLGALVCQIASEAPALHSASLSALMSIFLSSGRRFIWEGGMLTEEEPAAEDEPLASSIEEAYVGSDSPSPAEESLIESMDQAIMTIGVEAAHHVRELTINLQSPAFTIPRSANLDHAMGVLLVTRAALVLENILICPQFTDRASLMKSIENASFLAALLVNRQGGAAEQEMKDVMWELVQVLGGYCAHHYAEPFAMVISD